MSAELEAGVAADSYGLTAEAGRPQASPAGGVAWPVRSGLVPPLAEGFITRTETLPDLETALVPGAVLALVTDQTAGGTRESCGKTQLAVHLAGSLWQSRDVDLLAWVDAASRASVLSGYGHAAARLGLDHGGDAEAVAARFLAWLAGTHRPWLVVLDDLHAAADLDGLWPTGPAGRVLITTADAATVIGAPGALAVAVPVFSIREALGYLSGRLTTDPDQRGGAVDLAGELGCGPVALAQAAAVIISTGIRCREYLDHFLDRRSQSAQAGEPATAAGLTWAVSASHAEQLAPGSAWRLLVLAALTDGHAVPGTVFTAPATCQYLADQDAGDPPDPQRAWSALLALERAGLVAIDPASAPPAVWVSPALQAAARTAASPDLLERAARAAADALVQAWPTGQPRSELAARLRSCAASLRLAGGDALWVSGGIPRVLLAAGQSLDGAGLTGPAVTWWRALAADSQRLLGPAHPDTLVAGGQLAGALLAAGRPAEAVTWFRWLASSLAGMLGPDHRGTIAARVSLGRALVAAGQPGDAVQRSGGSGPAQRARPRDQRRRDPDSPGRICRRVPGGGKTRRGNPFRPAVAGRPRAAARTRPSQYIGRPAAAGRGVPGRGKGRRRHRPVHAGRGRPGAFPGGRSPRHAGGARAAGRGL